MTKNQHNDKMSTAGCTNHGVSHNATIRPRACKYKCITRSCLIFSMAYNVWSVCSGGICYNCYYKEAAWREISRMTKMPTAGCTDHGVSHTTPIGARVRR